MKFVNFNNFNFMFNELKQPLTITLPANNPNERDDMGMPINDKSNVKHVIEPVIDTTNPNLTFTNTEGGQQSELSTVWESKAIQNAPRNTQVDDSHGNHYKTVASAHPTPTGLWYYQLKETGDKS